MNGSLLTPPSPRASSSSPLPPSPSPSPPSPSLLPHPPSPSLPPHPASLSDTPTPSPSPSLSWTDFCELHARVAAGDFARHYRAFLLENPRYPPDSAAAFCRRFTARFVCHFQSQLEAGALGKEAAGWVPNSDATSLEEEPSPPPDAAASCPAVAAAASCAPAAEPVSARAGEGRGAERFQDTYAQALPPSSSSSCSSSAGGNNGRREDVARRGPGAEGWPPLGEGAEEGPGETEAPAEDADPADACPATPALKGNGTAAKNKVKKRFSLRSVGRSVRGSVRGILHWRSSSSEAPPAAPGSGYGYAPAALPVSLSLPLALPHSSSSSLPPSSSSSAASLSFSEARDRRRSAGEDKDKWSHRLEKLRLSRSPPPLLPPSLSPGRPARLVREGGVAVSSSSDQLSGNPVFPGFSFGLYHLNHSADDGPQTAPPATGGAVGWRGGRWQKCRLVLRASEKEGGERGEEYFLEFFIPPKVSMLKYT